MHKKITYITAIALYIIKFTKDINYEYCELDSVEEYNHFSSQKNYYAIVNQQNIDSSSSNNRLVLLNELKMTSGTSRLSNNIVSSQTSLKGGRL
jgi:hypothetical protein